MMEMDLKLKGSFKTLPCCILAPDYIEGVNIALNV
jgi:hypothetical protein